MSMNDEVREAISKNLPQTVGEELRKRLDQADKDATAYKACKERKDELLEANRAMTKKIQNYEALEGAIKELEVNVITREKEITKLELTAQYEQEKRELTVSLFGTVFANRIVRESAQVQRPFSSTYNNGQLTHQEGYAQETETKETEEG